MLISNISPGSTVSNVSVCGVNKVTIKYRKKKGHGDNLSAPLTIAFWTIRSCIVS